MYDNFLFFKADISETRSIRHILSTYEEASGQAISLTKSGIFFSKNVDPFLGDAIKSVLGVEHSLDIGRYLGLPSLIGRSKRAVFMHLKDIIWKKIQAWRGLPLSKGGKEVLIKSVAQAIPLFCTSTFMLHVSLADETQRMISFFWWGSKKFGERCINLLSWDRLCVCKEFEGYGFSSSLGL